MEMPRCPVPIVLAIIEREHNGETEILVQTRWKPEKDPKYSGTIEVVAGTLDKGETVYEALRREVFEETGLHVTHFTPDMHTQTHSQRNDDSWAFVPFCCVQQTRELNRIGFVFLCRVEEKQPVGSDYEVKDVRWIQKSELKKILEETPEKIFTFELGALDYYLNKVQ